ncbi:MAG: hypothetical protein UT48_C0047G0003 [Parcubacteria group bacterium GW2011_GWE2_39_37]|uniref:Uncharacterized protein n=1 Tax=Candidatus Falkowbacteria bacterium GW2011_GWF2_39_8 TaxID=1618642 RepID=A0A0G0PWG3_9BACT|nr:MAG: hypothetical protein UT48_C0047G0003 [Parcubacteria group bacterium GW2011_GWE2_39_37]KKR32504.1 MAG: hypothetical protein UT64_C0032G0018 [Candidatus Falkowbacteria bacterium GW2011_GWF2_39_8]
MAEKKASFGSILPGPFKYLLEGDIAYVKTPAPFIYEGARVNSVRVCNGRPAFISAQMPVMVDEKQIAPTPF